MLISGKVFIVILVHVHKFRGFTEDVLVFTSLPIFTSKIEVDVGALYMMKPDLTILWNS